VGYPQLVGLWSRHVAGHEPRARLPAAAVVVAMVPAVQRAASPSAGQHNSHRDVAKRAEQYHNNPQGEPHLTTLPFLMYS